MQHSVTLDLYEYWIALKGQRYAPQRHEVEPNGIRSLLSNTFVLETDPLEGTHFRLAGTDICTLIGRDLKQSDFFKLWGDHGRETLESSVRILRDNSAGIFATWTGHTARYHKTQGEMLMLPMIHDGLTSRVLGSFVASERPYWQGTFPITTLDLSDIRVILPSEHGLPLFDETESPKYQPESAEASFPHARTTNADVFTSANRGRRVRHLTILDGGQSEL